MVDNVWCVSMLMKKAGALCGWIGMILIQLSVIPSTVKLLYGITANTPPLDLVLMVWAGLLLFLIRSVTHKDMLYITSNGIGFVFQSILLALILIK
jgi:hypothetical protein